MSRIISTAFLRCVKWEEGSKNVDDGVTVKIRADVAFFFFLFFCVCGLKSALMRRLTTASFSSRADNCVSVCSSQKEVRRTSHRVRRRRGPAGAPGRRRDRSGSSRPLPPPQTTTSSEKEQVRPERAAASVTTLDVRKKPLKGYNASPNTGPHQTSRSFRLTETQTCRWKTTTCVRRNKSSQVSLQ